MYYQLPSGKTIQISIDDYLNMTDEMEQYLISQNVGDSLSAWHDSAIKPRKTVQKEEEDDILDHLDYEADDEELRSEQDIDINNIPDEEASDLPF